MRTAKAAAGDFDGSSPDPGAWTRPAADPVKEEGMEERLAGMLRAIVSDAEMIPDPRMDGATDIYAVPLGDIEDARELLMERRMLQLHPRG